MGFLLHCLFRYRFEYTPPHTHPRYESDRAMDFVETGAPCRAWGIRRRRRHSGRPHDKQTENLREGYLVIFFFVSRHLPRKQREEEEEEEERSLIDRSL